MKPVRTYEVRIKDHASGLYSARSPGKALGRAWRAFGISRGITFKNFMSPSSVHRVPDPPGCGERIVVNGRTVTKAYGPRGAVHFMEDGSDAVLTAHPTDVLGAAQAAGVEV